MRWIFRLLLMIFLLSVVSVSGYYYVGYSLSPTSVNQTVEVEIPLGASVFSVGKALEEKGLVKNKFLFAIYVYMKGKSKDIKAGVYEVPPSSDANEILDIFTDGSKNVMRLTVPEGFTAKQIAEKLENKGMNGEAFLKAVNRKDRSDSFLRNVPVNQKRRYRLEGYLFPMTYNLPKDADPDQLVDKMLKQFQKHMKQEGFQQKLKKHGLTMDEWVTIASIIEREAKVQDEFPRVSGVIHNRLKIRKKLQVDATVQYALGEQKERLYYKDLRIKSPYNTYRIGGLPPGPISNPGREALKAALEPENHQYLFYVTRKDGSGLHYFARTEAEHQRNIERSKQEAKKHGDGS
ncbi:endolytic transglycosylase MltG [Melghirimyces algeriensis]|uniref:Endolytic murein transglycosylase n=1 Tax=Melghirimyces algeriensis TaxID=910412 RepID=A0A521CUZ4_9BACL|nr:endolytic transglycosylase MltG [Melghirimyces algeriensis]SMO63252.1 UPF0755 protein [Melghirimyces algeriensis]